MLHDCAFAFALLLYVFCCCWCCQAVVCIGFLGFLCAFKTEARKVKKKAEWEKIEKRVHSSPRFGIGTFSLSLGWMQNFDLG